jgi:hypothetical protein
LKEKSYRPRLRAGRWPRCRRQQAGSTHARCRRLHEVLLARADSQVTDTVDAALAPSRGAVDGPGALGVLPAPGTAGLLTAEPSVAVRTALEPPFQDDLPRLAKQPLCIPAWLACHAQGTTPTTALAVPVMPRRMRPSSRTHCLVDKSSADGAIALGGPVPCQIQRAPTGLYMEGLETGKDHRKAAGERWCYRPAAPTICHASLSRDPPVR